MGEWGNVAPHSWMDHTTCVMEMGLLAPERASANAFEMWGKEDVRLHSILHRGSIRKAG